MNVFAYVDRRSLTYNDVFSIVRGIEEYNTLIQLVRNNTQEMRSSRHAQRTVQSMLTLWNSARLFNSLSKVKATSIRNSELWADKVCRYYCIVTFALSMYSQSVNIWFRFQFGSFQDEVTQESADKSQPQRGNRLQHYEICELYQTPTQSSLWVGKICSCNHKAFHRYVHFFIKCLKQIRQVLIKYNVHCLFFVTAILLFRQKCTYHSKVVAAYPRFCFSI